MALQGAVILLHSPISLCATRWNQWRRLPWSRTGKIACPTSTVWGGTPRD